MTHIAHIALALAAGLVLVAAAARLGDLVGIWRPTVRVAVMAVLPLFMLATPVVAQMPPIPVPRPLPTPYEDRPGDEAATGTTHVVVRGEHLWSIASDHLQRDGTRPSVATVAPYWRRVVRSNVPRLRSGDPDLIYPGEVVELPAVSREGS